MGLGKKPLSRVYLSLATLIIVVGCAPPRSGTNKNSLTLGSTACPNDSFSQFSSPKLSLSTVSAAPKATFRGVDVESFGTNSFTSQRMQNKSNILPIGQKISVLAQPACLKRSGSDLAKEFSDYMDLETAAQTIELKKATTFQELAAWVSKEPCVLSIGAEKEISTKALDLYFQPSDPRASEQHHLESIEQTKAFETLYGVDGLTQNVIVAVLDTGVNYNHPDLKNQMWKKADGTYGRDYHSNDLDPMDDLPTNVGVPRAHGTHVAGLIAAQVNNNIGGAGAGGNRVKIMAVRVMAADSGSVSKLINGIGYAVANGANVINISAAAPGTNENLKTALAQAVAAGATVIVAAGNDGENLSSNPLSPAIYGRDIPGVITVGSLDSRTGKYSQFSNFDANLVELTAPGAEDSWSGATGLLSTTENGYSRKGGTSMSAPLASAAAALAIGYVRSKRKAVTPAQVESLILKANPRRADFTEWVKNGKVLSLAEVVRGAKEYISGKEISEGPVLCKSSDESSEEGSDEEF